MTSSAHCRVVQALMLVAWLLGPSTSLFAQATIRLYSGVAPGSEGWSLPESSVPGVPGFEQYGPWLTNVAEPTLTVFRPDPGTSTGTAVVVCPGGGFHFLSMENEGVKVAEWLRARGITAFVLKYRVLQTTPEHMGRVIAESVKHIDEEMAPVFPLAMADARSALGYVRGHAVEFGILPTRLGVIGFSAGGMGGGPHPSDHFQGVNLCIRDSATLRNGTARVGFGDGNLRADTPQAALRRSVRRFSP